MRPKGGSPISRRIVISSVLAVVVGLALVSVISLARRPVLGAPLGRGEARSATRVQVDRAGKIQVPQHDLQPSVPTCGSTAFVDYVEGAIGKATPIAAVRAYRPGARNLLVKALGANRAVVEEFRRGVKIASYGLFRMKKSGWLVERADTFEPCGAPQ